MISLSITCYNCLGLFMFSAHSFPLFYASSLCSLSFSGFVASHHLPPLKFHFFFSFLASLFKMTKQEPPPALPSDSSSVSSPSPVPSTTPNPPPSAFVYKSLYHWAPTVLLNETSNFTFLQSIADYRKKQTCHKSCVFGKDHDKFVSMVAC